MCNINATGLGLQTASTIANTIENYSQLKSQGAYQTAQNKAVLNNYTQQLKTLNNNYAAEQTTNAIQRQQNYLQNLQAKSTAQAAAASSGTIGNSIDNLFRGYDRTAAINNYISARDLHMKGLQYNDKLNSLKYSAINSLNYHNPYQSGASTLLGGTSSLFNMYRKHYNDYLKQQKLEDNL